MAWSPSIELVTLAEAKQHLKIPDYDSPSAEDESLQVKLYIAHELVIDYLSNRLEDQDEWIETMEDWTSSTAPKRVLGAILYEFGRLYRNRGDDDERGKSLQPILSPETRILLDRLRDPTIA